MKTAIKRREEMEQDKVPMQAAIWGRMSMASKELVMMSKYWSKVKTLSDPLALWKAICDTHASFSSGDADVDLNEAFSYFYSLKQKSTETLPYYKAAFDAAFEELRERVPHHTMLPAQLNVSIQFITSLDPARFAELQLTYRNKVMPYPATLREAYQAASEWMIVPRNYLTVTGYRATRASSHVAFPMLHAADVLVSDADTHSPESGSRAGGREQRKGGNKKKDAAKKPQYVCYACNKTGHKIQDCPLLGAFRKEHGDKIGGGGDDDEGKALVVRGGESGGTAMGLFSVTADELREYNRLKLLNPSVYY